MKGKYRIQHKRIWLSVSLAVIALCAIGISFYSYMQQLSDLRTEYARARGDTIEAQRKGRRLLQDSLASMDPDSRWKKVRARPVKIVLRHYWYHALLKAFVMPVERSGQTIALRFRPAFNNIQLTFMDGKRKDLSWGIRDQKTYRIDRDGKTLWEPDSAIEFHLPSYRFFLFLPFHLSEAELITYAGTKDIRGERYDLVYATWGKWSPQSDVDQYLVWIRRDTGRIDFVQSTVREVFNRSVVTLQLSDYKNAMGMSVPHSLRAHDDHPSSGHGMHLMKVIEMQTEDSDLE